MPERSTGLADHGAELEVDGLEVWIDTATALRRQGIEQLIAPEIAVSLRFDHSNVARQPGRDGDHGAEAAPHVDPPV
ncbi:MAG: hypothetical protein E6614_08280 [Bradyrhizobium sp.]|uniref:hypothetical protein n=1 Tax=Bradyrhizobium TaxID=374 RepID=UPI001FE9DAC2|nr:MULTISPECIES: hypothetical protein [Bradyrhizobium]MDU0955567.1 hypothetical protein [Bradyrhizobium sp.]MDU1496869.1 hypothetical protein [Bradyrhizobium sp.]MDU1546993.1 hypothetical protein [Bradyrhizobium sp.]MDU1665665.1 hypothetical protein [Bradyrhizobium sp.]MDU1694984.1 hypothetical protein [Bradyrhizobium sp.]